MDTSSLDRPDIYLRNDPGGMRQQLEDFPRLFLRGWEEAAGLQLPEAYRGVDRVLLHGMGGSAIAGDLLADLARGEPAGPMVVVHRDYGLPAWVNDRTLVIASSASGGTEEVLSGLALVQAQDAKAVAFTGGGKLARAAETAGLPICPLPQGAPPRTLLPFALGALLRMLTDLGILSTEDAEVRAVVDRLAELRSSLDCQVAAANNRAKILAHSLYGRLPLIYSAHVLSSVGRRWRTQLNENAKVLALAEELPETQHNGVMGLEHVGIPREHLCVVLLESPSAPPRVRLRFRAFEDILDDLGIPYHHGTPKAGTPLAEVLSTILLGDYVSYYLAMLNGVDASRIGLIDRIKVRLSGGADEAMSRPDVR